MAKRWDVRLSGAGGQGLITAGIILAEAAGIYDDMSVVQTQVYGAQSRGGASKSEVIISDGAIVYPEVINPDILLAMSQESVNAYVPEVRDDGIMVIDSFFAKTEPPTKAKAYRLPLTTIARDEVGMDIAASIVALGVIQALTNIVTRGSLDKAVLARSPKGFEANNIKALHAGYRAGEELKQA